MSEKQSSAFKALKQSKNRNHRNCITKSRVKTYKNKCLISIKEKQHAKTSDLFSKLQSLVSKAAQKHVINKNKASRIISSVHKKVKTLEAN